MVRLRRDVRLASLGFEHASNMYRWMCDTEVSQNLGLRTQPSLEKTRAWIEHALQDVSVCPFAVLLGDEHVGNVILDRLDDYLASARLSIYIGEPSRRQSGVGTTALYHALSEGFERRRLHKIWLTAHARNYQAIATYSRLGFVLEGLLRDEFWLEGQRLPVVYMGLLRDEFERLVVE